MTETATDRTSSYRTDSSDDRTWAMLCHLAAFSGWVGIPFGHILGPLVIYLIKKDGSALVSDQGKEALNFQISMTIYMILSAVLALVVVGIFLLIALGIAEIVLVIIAAVKAHNGEFYRYPITIRFLK